MIEHGVTERGGFSPPSRKRDDDGHYSHRCSFRNAITQISAAFSGHNRVVARCLPLRFNQRFLAELDCRPHEGPFLCLARQPEREPSSGMLQFARRQFTQRVAIAAAPSIQHTLPPRAVGRLAIRKRWQGHREQRQIGMPLRIPSRTNPLPARPSEPPKNTAKSSTEHRRRAIQNVGR